MHEINQLSKSSYSIYNAEKKKLEAWLSHIFFHSMVVTQKKLFSSFLDFFVLQNQFKLRNN